MELAKGPGFSKDSWAPLADIVATDEFVRVGNFKEVMNWPEYVDFLTNWATASTWEGSFKRLTETPDLVILELEERSSVGDFSSVVNSVSVYEFDDAGKVSPSMSTCRWHSPKAPCSAVMRTSGSPNEFSFTPTGNDPP